MSLYVRFGFFCGRKTAMPAVEGPPSLVLKNLICVALGLPRMIVQATIVPERGAERMLVAEPTLTWKPVVRLTARHGLPGQLGTVAGVVAPMIPTSLRVAGARAGSASSASAVPPRIAVILLRICVMNTPASEMVRSALVSLRAGEFLRGGRDLPRISGRWHPGQPQRVFGIARDDVDVEVKHGLPGDGAAGVDEVDAIGRQLRAHARGEALRG